MKVKHGAWILCGLVCLLNSGAAGDRPADLELPAPETRGGIPLMTALGERCSTKAYQAKPLAPETLSNLLWAAFGINRPDTGKRTAATAFNCQNIDIYVVLPAKTYRYHAAAHRLEVASTEDLRPLAASQAYARPAAVQLLYVADDDKIDDRFGGKKSFYAAFHAGSISQNVYLFCASAGLGSVVRDGVDREALKKALALGDNQHIVMAQTVGHVQN
jgi:SagB-type dehydrogenase family enzyme